jgi:hypothetical protein
MQERIGYIYMSGNNMKCIRADDSAIYQVRRGSKERGRGEPE